MSYCNVIYWPNGFVFQMRSKALTDGVEANYWRTMADSAAALWTIRSGVPLQMSIIALQTSTKDK